MGWRELSRGLERKVKVLKLEVHRGRGGQESDQESQLSKRTLNGSYRTKLKK